EDRATQECDLSARYPRGTSDSCRICCRSQPQQSQKTKSRIDAESSMRPKRPALEWGQKEGTYAILRGH
ncbi:MAG: hypothetical protein L0Z53_12925, partial [Acidobacteriales bacterium]|nr:hypothetical protein [Terriglobales bacterium]